MRVLRMLGAALLWVLGVAAVASMASLAINSAGQQVVARTVTVGQQDAGADLPAPATTSPGPVQSTSTSLGPAVGTTTAAPTHPRTSAGTAASGTGTGASSRTSSRPSTTTRPPQPTSPALSDERTTAGGSVWVECTGPVVTDALVQPGDGWAAHSGQQTSSDLEASFLRSTSRIDVTVSCRSGQPSFQVSTHSGGDDH